VLKDVVSFIYVGRHSTIIGAIHGGPKKIVSHYRVNHNNNHYNHIKSY